MSTGRIALLLFLTLPPAPLRADLLAEAVERHRAGELEVAIEIYRRAAESAPGTETEAAARSNSCAALNDLGRFVEALADCEVAIVLRRAAAEPKLADTLNNQALALDSLGRTRDAEVAYVEALALYRAGGQAADEALVLSNLASLAIGRGELGDALAWIDEAERLALAADDAPWAATEAGVARENRAVALERLGAYREALAELRAVAAAAPAEASQAATRAINVAVLYRNLGDPWRALSELDRAQRLAAPGDRSTRANLALNRGLVRLLNLDDPVGARAELERAVSLARAAGDAGEAGRALVALGRAALAAGDGGAAEAAFRGALDASASTESAETRWTAHAGLARAAAAAGDVARALAELERALGILEATGAGVRAALRESLFSDQRAVYAARVDLLAGRALAGDHAAAGEALATAERARARELAEALAGGATAPLEASRLASLGRELGESWVYFAGEQRLWRFRLGPEGSLKIDDRGPASVLLADARALHDRLARGDTADVATLERLGRALVGDSTPAGTLRVVPDSTLFYLPFDLLPAGDGRPLAEHAALSYSPSLTVLARLPRAARPTQRKLRWDLAALADPAPAPATGGTAGLLARRFGLPALPGARREASTAAATIGGETAIATGADATEARFAELAGQGARILLIAAHTLIDERLGEGVAIYLAPGPGGDGALTPSELAGRPLFVDLAVLSGCRTALGGRRDGRSLSTLTGALLASGVRGVIATLWEVDDRAAEALIGALAWELARGTAPAEALRRAKRRLEGDPRWVGRHDWSAFVLIGDPPALPGYLRRPGLAALAAGLALAAALALGLRARRAGRPPDAGSAVAQSPDGKM